MDMDTKRRKLANVNAKPECLASSGAGLADVVERLRAKASVVTLRRGQTLPLTPAAQSVTMLVDGVVTVGTGSDPKHRNALRVIYPGEFLTIDVLPQIEGISAVAAARSTVLRIGRDKLNELAAHDAEIARFVSASEAMSLARQTLHVARLAMLSAEQRLASLMYELALALAVDRSSTGGAFEMPLTRREMAAYLGINADTLSRLMSRLKAKGLVAFTGRSRAVVPSPERLAGALPLSASIRAAQIGLQA